MSKAQHTPGPWSADYVVSFGAYIIGSVERVGILTAPVGCDDRVAEANALLIAAAPELLEALENISSLTEEKRLALITKAKGE